MGFCDLAAGTPQESPALDILRLLESAQSMVSVQIVPVLQAAIKTAAPVIGIDHPGPAFSSVVLLPVGAAALIIAAFVGQPFAQI